MKPRKPLFPQWKHPKTLATPADKVAAIEKLVVEEIEVGDVSRKQIRHARRAKVEDESGPRFPFLGDSILRLVLWGLATLAVLVARASWGPDETRTLALAWEAWTAHAPLLPGVQGVPQTTPPLFTLSVHALWLVAGVDERWARLAAPLFALASLFLVAKIARLLWPANPALAYKAPLVLLGSLAWLFLSTLTATDTLRLFFVLVSWWGLLIYWRRLDYRAWLLVGMGLGGNALSGGFFGWLYVLLPALLAPFWIDKPKPKWRYWYVDLGKAMGLGALMGGAWLAWVAAHQGVSAVSAFFTLESFLMPSKFFSTEQPFWWHALLLWLMLLPWSLWPLPLMRLWHIRGQKLNAGFLFCLAASAPVLIALSLFSTKQPQYLLPVLVPFTLAVTWLLYEESLASHGEHSFFSGFSLPLIFIGALLAALPKLPRVAALPEMLWQLSPFVGVGLIGLGILFAWLPSKDAVTRARSLVLGSVAFFVLLQLTLVATFDEHYSVHAPSQFVAKAVSQQQPVAVLGEYDGELNFPARTKEPFVRLAPENLSIWASQHPNGVILATGAWPGTGQPIATFDKEGRHYRFYEAGTLFAKTP